MYCMVVALAKGISLIVMKKRNKAVIPVTPRINNHFLLFPKKGIPSLRIQKTQMTNEMRDRKKMISCVGIWCRNLTQKLARA